MSEAVVRGKTYKLVLIDREFGSLCRGCAFYDDEDGCDTVGEECFNSMLSNDIDKTFVWKEIK